MTPVYDAPPPVIALSATDAGELLTLQRAAYVSEAQLHHDLDLPPLTETLEALQTELVRPELRAWGVREQGRLVAAVRVLVREPVADLGRLIVAPDRQGRGLGSHLLRHVEGNLSEAVTSIELFTGERSERNLRLYRRHGYSDTHLTPTGTYDLVHLKKTLNPDPMTDRGLGLVDELTADSGSVDEMRVRRAGSKDRAAVVELLDLRARWLHDHGIVRQWPSPFPDRRVTPALEAGHTWVLEDADRKIMATFTLEDADGLWPPDRSATAPVYLHRLAVAPGRPGLGRRILAHVAHQLAASGRTALRLDCVTSNPKLCAYYERAGFVLRAQSIVHATPGDGWPAGSSAELALYELLLVPEPPAS